MSTELWQNDREIVNNAYYDTLGSSWTEASSDPVALLRAEGRLKNAWVVQTLFDRDILDVPVLDIGCGGGFLTNELARYGFEVTGIDLSESSLQHARAMDSTKTVRYKRADAYSLPFSDRSFRVVTCFDFLEHVSDPEKVIKEASRVLRPGGLFFYHTFNRNWLSSLVVIKGLEWFVSGTPDKLHVSKLFIKPIELHEMLAHQGLNIREERGLRPRLNRSFWKMLMTGHVDSGFSFAWTKMKLISYAGMAEKKADLIGPR